MNKKILDPEVQTYLHANQLRDPSQIALAASPFEGISPSELAEQIDSRQRSKSKLPTWYESQEVYFPKKLAIEQCSSEIAAAYKASLIQEGKIVLDMTGGLGVDSLYFAKKSQQVDYIERNLSLAEISQHNALKLGGKNIQFLRGDSIELLHEASSDRYDLIFLDPARRAGTQKVFLLSDCEPDITQLQALLFEKSRQILLKAAPMLDIRAALRQLKNTKEVHILSIAGECKELLFLQEKNYEGLVQLTATALNKKGEIIGKKLSFYGDEEQAAPLKLALPSGFLYEADVAVQKAGAFKLIAQRYNIDKIHQHTHLYSAEKLIPDFIGKTTRILQIIPYRKIKKNHLQLEGNVISKNFPIKVAELRKKHKIKEKSDRNLYFCTNMNDELIVIETEAIKIPSH